uniref:Major facilitator superfamily (MFS) profile domain-containing protein n=1 Tax=Plectus sambesii TaxID=2011161 RepID=A0A914WMU3_9BILA
MATPRTKNVAAQFDTSYSWLIMVASFLVQTVIFGTLSSLGVYYAHFVEDLSWSPSQAAIIPSAVFGTSCLMGPIVSVMYYSIGSRCTTILGGLLTFAGFVAAFLADSSDRFWITFAFCIVGIGVGTALGSCHPIITEYFLKYRHTALTVSTIGGAFGPFLIPVIVQYFLKHYGFQGAALLHGGLALQVVVLGMLMRSTGAFETSSSKLRDKCQFQLLKQPLFLLMCLNCAMWGGTNFIHSSMINTLIIERGLSADTAALMVSASGAANLIGRILVALIAHKGDNLRIWLYFATSTMFTIGVSLCVIGSTVPEFLSFQLLNGLGFGSMRSISPSLMLYLFGPENMSASRGFMTPFVGASGLLAPLLAGLLAEAYDMTAAYYLATGLGLVNVITCIGLALKSHGARTDTKQEPVAAEPLEIDG